MRKGITKRNVCNETYDRKKKGDRRLEMSVEFVDQKRITCDNTEVARR